VLRIHYHTPVKMDNYYIPLHRIFKFLGYNKRNRLK
jgi:uncharacterized protein (UPF0248 family)